MSEYKVQVFFDGGWLDIMKNIPEWGYTDYKNYTKGLRDKNPDKKYRIMGRECHPWCEIKEC